MELPAKPRRVVPTTPAGTLQTARLHALRGGGEIVFLVGCVALSGAYHCHIEYHCHYIFLFNCYCYCGIVVITLAWLLQTVRLRAMRGSKIVGC